MLLYCEERGYGECVLKRRGTYHLYCGREGSSIYVLGGNHQYFLDGGGEEIIFNLRRYVLFN